ncbi:PAS domain-containing protein [Streptomyces sp. NPDC096132]|uniref:PAS domain-containing protein n=1 Tax=Streptomyces sp. NPDC096132 TaxID=3366075 RepID=UPI00380DD20A
MVHQRGGMHRMRLVAAVGLPPPLAQAWEDIEWDEAVAPALAARESTYVWLPVHASSESIPEGGTPGRPTAPRARARTLPDGTGLAAVPLPGPQGPLGALSVVTATSTGPDLDQQAFLGGLAAQVAERLQQSPPAPSGLSPAWWQQPSESYLRQAMKAVEVGGYDWNIRTGEVFCDEAVLAAGGLTQDTFDGRIETWLGLVHPDDISGVLAQGDKAIADRNVYSAEYRVCRPDGSVAWVEARGQVVLGEDGEPAHMIGTLWNTTQTRIARDSVVRALRHMSDGFFAVDTDWCITYANIEAERLFGTADRLLGRVLWDAVPDISSLGLEAPCRRAVASGTPVGLDAQWRVRRCRPSCPTRAGDSRCGG